MAANTRLSGMAKARLDERARVAVPAKMFEDFRNIAVELTAGTPVVEPLEVVVGIDDRLQLAIFPKASHERMMQLVESKPDTPTWMDIKETVTGYLEEMQLDKQNRFKIPEVLLEAFEIDGEVIMVGQRDRLLLKPATKSQARLTKMLENSSETRAKAYAEESGEG